MTANNPSHDKEPHLAALKEAYHFRPRRTECYHRTWLQMGRQKDAESRKQEPCLSHMGIPTAATVTGLLKLIKIICETAEEWIPARQAQKWSWVKKATKCYKKEHLCLKEQTHRTWYPVTKLNLNTGEYQCWTCSVEKALNTVVSMKWVNAYQAVWQAECFSLRGHIKVSASLSNSESQQVFIDQLLWKKHCVN